MILKKRKALLEFFGGKTKVTDQLKVSICWYAWGDLEKEDT